jgi:hypothetical protein
VLPFPNELPMEPTNDFDTKGAPRREAGAAGGNSRSGVIRHATEPRPLKPLGLARSAAYFLCRAQRSF